MSTLSQGNDVRQASVMDTPKYITHPEVVKARLSGHTPPLPLAIYIDGVRFIAQSAGRSESVAGVWIENLLTSRRHFLVGIKSGDMCMCGCRGWCSLQPILAQIAWQLEVCQRGYVPYAYPDGAVACLQERPWPTPVAWCGSRATGRSTSIHLGWQGGNQNTLVVNIVV